MTDKSANQMEKQDAERQDVRLTVVGWGDEEARPINFGLIGKQLKRMFAFWMALAMGLGLLAGVAVGGLQLLSSKGVIHALVGLSLEDDAAEYDIMKVKSPGVVENALNTMGLDLKDVERVRNAIQVEGVIPDQVQDQLSMYYSLLSQGGSGGSTAVQSLINTSYDVSRYIISLAYSDAKMSKETGISFMDALLRSYQEYCAETYDLNDVIGNPLNSVDYRDYDYAEAVNIFSTALDNVRNYLTDIVAKDSSTNGFRSVESGFSFQDLLRDVQILRDVNLDWVSSYVVIHSVSSYDADMEISYYEWLIEDLARQRAVELSRLSSLTKSIEEYEKDPILVAVQDGNSVIANMEDTNANYDAMITEKLDTQSRIAAFNRSISYYERVIEGFRSGEASRPEDIQKVETYLADLNEKLNALFENVSKTADEYYVRVAFSDRVRVLMPPSSQEPSLFSTVTLLAGIGTVAVVLFLYFLLAVTSAGQQSAQGDPSGKDDVPQDQRRAERTTERGAET